MPTKRGTRSSSSVILFGRLSGGFISKQLSKALHTQFDSAPKDLYDLRVRIVCRPPGVYQHNALRVPRRNGQIGTVDTPKESAALVFEAVFVVFPAAISGGVRFVAAAGALHAGGYLGVHDDGQ